MSDPSRIFVAGDWHGDATFARKMAFMAAAHECDAIIQLGDFGIWPGPQGKHWLADVDRALDQVGIELWFVDGNHDDHDQIATWTPNPETGFHDLTERLHHIPRSHRWEWNGVRFLGLGGAHSIDRHKRVPYQSWWPQEAITLGQAATAEAGLPVDVMFTHDAPAGFNPLHPATPLFAPETETNRMLLRQVMIAAQPTIVFCGHWHNRASTQLTLPNGWTTTVEVLDCNQAADPADAWDTLELKATAR